MIAFFKLSLERALVNGRGAVSEALLLFIQWLELLLSRLCLFVLQDVRDKVLNGGTVWI